MIDYLAAKMSVPCSRLHLKDSIFDGEHGDIKGASAKVKDQHIVLAATFLVKAVGNRRSCWFVDDPENGETSNDAGILGCLSLAVVEIGRHLHTPHTSQS